MLILGFLSACIKPFTPKIDSDSSSKIVVSGKLTNREGYQYVSLSKTIPLDKIGYQAYENSKISIWDENGNEFKMQEYKAGEYRVWMNQEDLEVGTAYHIQIKTPEGDELQSEPEIMSSVGDVKIPRYNTDSIYNGAYEYYAKGLQFSIDVEGDETTSRFYMFELDATYEHHALYAREWYYDGAVHRIYPPDSSRMYCWTTYRVPEIITLSTENLGENKFNNLDLHFVSFRANYLTYGYSLLVRQVGLSREAFTYWESVRLNNNQNASLYSKQPVDTQGNIHNITHPEKEVIGYYSASAISEIRIFIEPMATEPFVDCIPAPLERGGFKEISKSEYPAYLMSDNHGSYLMIWLQNSCVDCAANHGTTAKPSFWPY